MENFRTLLFESVIEYFFYSIYFKKQYLCEGYKRFIWPPIFYRFNPKRWLIFCKDTGEILRDVWFSWDEMKQIITTQDMILNSDFSFQKYIINYDKRYSFLFYNASDKLTEPKSDVEILSLLQDNPEDLFLYQALLWYYYTRGCRVEDYPIIEKILSLDSNNPFILAWKMRYLSSVMYKKTKQTSYIHNSLVISNYVLKHNEYQLSFFYYWTAWSLFACHKYDRAIKVATASIELNKSQWCNRAEPYIIVLRSLYNLGNLREFYEVYQSFEVDSDIQWKDEKTDFMIYHLLARYYYSINEYKLFELYFIKALKDFMNLFEIEFSQWRTLYSLKKDNVLVFFNGIIQDISSGIIFKKQQDSFLMLAEKYYHWAIIFLNLRGIEENFIDYYTLKHEWKI